MPKQYLIRTTDEQAWRIVFAYARRRRRLRPHSQGQSTQHACRFGFRRDVTLQEDRSQVRTRHVPALLALLNCTVLALMDLLGVRNMAANHLPGNVS